MTWILDHLDDIGEYTLQHAWLAGLPLILGLAVALPLGWFARRWSWAYTPVVVGTGLLYTIPSLALFILMPLILRHADPRPAQRRGRDDRLHRRSAHPHGRRRARLRTR